MEQRSSVSKQNVLALFSKSMKRGYGSFYFDGILKSEKIKTKKAYRNWLEPGLVGGNSVSEDFCSAKEIVYLHRNEKIANISKSIKAKNEIQYFREKVQKILNAKCSDEDYLDFPQHSDVGFAFSAWKCEENRTLYQGNLTLYISLFCIKPNVNDVAEHLWGLCKGFCNHFSHSSGYVTLSSIRGNEYVSPVMNYFNHYDEGIVFDADSKKMYDVPTWLNLQYIEGLEWANIIPSQVDAKVIDLNGAKENCPSFIIEKFENGSVILKNKKDITEHRASDFEMCYEHFRACLRPGYSEHSIFNIRKGWDEIYISPDEYLVKDSQVCFRRGKFDFITKHY